MALEWNRVDIALFDRLPREENSPSVVIESKCLHNACLSTDVLGQALDYAKKYENCTRVILTDGLRFGIYVKRKKDWSSEQRPYAYFNICRPRAKYPIYEDDYGNSLKGAMEALYAMTPNWVLGSEHNC